MKLLTILIAALALALAGCATSKRLHGDVNLNGPTLVVTGPARGHFQEEENREFFIYVVVDSDCRHVTWPERVVKGSFTINSGMSICALPISQTSRVYFHAERP